MLTFFHYCNFKSVLLRFQYLLKWGGCSGTICFYFWVSFSELLYFCVGFFNSPMPFLGLILPIFAYFLLYIMCILSKRQTVFWGIKTFRDVLQLIPNFLRYQALFLYCSFWKALLATNCLMLMDLIQQ